MHAPSLPAPIRRRPVLLLITCLLSLSSSASAASPVHLVSQRTIEIPDTRILSMSPDGGAIAALRPAIGFRDGELCVYAIETLAETACANLAPLDAGVRLDSIVWSPDGGHLAMTEEAFRLYVDGDLWLMDAATGALTNLDDDGYQGTLPFGDDVIAGTITVDASPTFTADGSGVTFSRSTWQDGERRGNDIATVPITGGPAVQLVQVSPTVPGLVYFGMRWASDGSTLYYSVDDVDVDSDANGIHAVQADGSEARLVAGRTDPEVGEPAISQASGTGDRLLAWHPRGTGQMVAPYTLSLIDAATGAATPLVVDQVDGLPSVERVQMATLSPDGRLLLEVTRGTDPDHQARIRELATGDLTPLAPDGLAVGGPSQSGVAPTWSTNGTVLIPGGGALSEATLLTIEGGLPQ